MLLTNVTKGEIVWSTSKNKTDLGLVLHADLKNVWIWECQKMVHVYHLCYEISIIFKTVCTKFFFQVSENVMFINTLLLQFHEFIWTQDTRPVQQMLECNKPKIAFRIAALSSSSNQMLNCVLLGKIIKVFVVLFLFFGQDKGMMISM